MAISILYPSNEIRQTSHHVIQTAAASASRLRLRGFGFAASASRLRLRLRGFGFAASASRLRLRGFAASASWLRLRGFDCDVRRSKRENFKRSVTPRGWLRSARNFGKTRFRRFATFHFSTSEKILDKFFRKKWRKINK